MRLVGLRIRTGVGWDGGATVMAAIMIPQGLPIQITNHMSFTLITGQQAATAMDQLRSAVNVTTQVIVGIITGKWIY